AMTFVRANAAVLGIEADAFKEKDIHLHVPEGAVPKDGPSAGITMATALASALSGIPVRANVAMTGEISLRGNVLPIGGLREKLLAAVRAGITLAVIPAENRRDMDEVPAEVKETLRIEYVENAMEALRAALTRIPEDQGAYPRLHKSDQTPAAQGGLMMRD
ncbi:MAG: endopeptidase La, partial [Clostridia bacterium]|nr:endopeptidase La [Clostridia bacterium]